MTLTDKRYKLIVSDSILAEDDVTISEQITYYKTKKEALERMVQILCGMLGHDGIDISIRPIYGNETELYERIKMLKEINLNYTLCDESWLDYTIEEVN